MDESNAFTKRHVEEVTAAQRTLLDELNLPPAVKQYILDNARFLQVSLLLLSAQFVDGVTIVIIQIHRTTRPPNNCPRRCC